MFTTVSDTNTIGELSAAAFKTIQQGGITNLQVTLQNLGVNVISYNFQQLNGASWQDIGEDGTIYQDTLSSGETVNVAINLPFAQIRLMCNASGGSTLGFSVSRYFDWTTGGFLPLIST